MAQAMAANPANKTVSDVALREIQQAQQLRSTAAQMKERYDNLGSELSDHNRVLEVLGKYDGSRTCFRRIGELLVERIVADVIPELHENVRNIEQARKKLEEQRVQLIKEADDLLKKHQDVLEEIGKNNVQQQQF